MAAGLVRCLKTLTKSVNGIGSSTGAIISHHIRLSRVEAPTQALTPPLVLFCRHFSSTTPTPCKVNDNGFVWEWKEVGSDDSAWSLYERWIAHFKLSRGSDEKLERFKIFRETAREVINHNKMRPAPYVERNGLNRFSDSDPDMGYPMFPSADPDNVKPRMRFVNMQIEDVIDNLDDNGEEQVTTIYSFEHYGQCCGPSENPQCCFFKD